MEVVGVVGRYCYFQHLNRRFKNFVFVVFIVFYVFFIVFANLLEVFICYRFIVLVFLSLLLVV